MDRYICIHGHFYQPPRENAWLESVELQDSAHPYHDWNERITVECYAPNTASRLMDEGSRIRGLVNNYTKISFDFGPTLLAWMQARAPETYQAILESDKKTREAYSGHGSALAQAYSHMIMPLANPRDKGTQILWGLRDFERRFGRPPEGMWLPETAVDYETLELMAGMGIRFTVLAPHQAKRVRPDGADSWQDVSGAKIDPTRPYLARLPSGQSMALFFYDGPISRAVAFEGVLSSGDEFCQRLMGAFSDERTWPQIVHIATDGETYGHHHPYGDMALAHTIDHIESEHGSVRLTNYGEYLEKHPPTFEVEIFENTSWSCAHGVERWRSDCGCNTGRQGWDQAWRSPLRQALDWLRDTLATRYEREAGRFLKDPWAARDDYIEVILSRSPQTIASFLERHASHPLDGADRVTVLKLLELQRHALLMYTSCGWFFDELSGVETVQIIQYAGRAIQLAEELFQEALEPRFLGLMKKARSNIPEHGDGRRIYEKFVKPARVDLMRVGAHYAVSSLFEKYSRTQVLNCYRVNLRDQKTLAAGKSRVLTGRAEIASLITGESAILSFGVLHLGDHNVNAGVREYRGGKAYAAMVQEVTKVFSGADFPEVIRVFDKHFGTHNFTIRTLFRDQQRKILSSILESTLREVDISYRALFERHYSQSRFIAELDIALPKALRLTAAVVINNDLMAALRAKKLDASRVHASLDEARLWGVDLDAGELSYHLTQTLNAMAARFVSSGRNLALLRDLVAGVRLGLSQPLGVNLWKVQNVCYDVMQQALPVFRSRAAQGDRAAAEWVLHFRILLDLLSIKAP